MADSGEAKVDELNDINSAIQGAELVEMEVDCVGELPAMKVEVLSADAKNRICRLVDELEYKTSSSLPVLTASDIDSYIMLHLVYPSMAWLGLVSFCLALPSVGWPGLAGP